MTDLRYPIGPFRYIAPDKESEILKLIASLQLLPTRLRVVVCDLSEDQLSTPYREGGWTVRQVVHHLADSHLNGYIRFKWTLTEENPEIKPYIQDAWANTPENDTTPVLISVALMENLHERWVHLLKDMVEEDFQRKFRHPETGSLSLLYALALYEWHGRHHVAQIETLRKRNGW